jgi:hypothetical protein
MAVDFFLNLILGDVVKVRHDGAWLGRSGMWVCGEDTGFLDGLDYIWGFKKGLEITDETCKMESAD